MQLTNLEWCITFAFILACLGGTGLRAAERGAAAIRPIFHEEPLGPAVKEIYGITKLTGPDGCHIVWMGANQLGRG